jgi:hypothetical protein
MSMLYLGQADLESLTARSDALNNTMIMISALFLRMSENLSISTLFFRLFKQHLNYFTDHQFLEIELFISLSLVKESLQKYRNMMTLVIASPTDTYSSDNRISERSFSLVKFKESVNHGLLTENLWQIAIDKASSTSSWLLNRPKEEQLRLIWRAMRTKEQNRRESIQARDNNLLQFAQNNNIGEEPDEVFSDDDDCD